jgi:hypothetical protein
LGDCDAHPVHIRLVGPVTLQKLAISAYNILILVLKELTKLWARKNDGILRHCRVSQAKHEIIAAQIVHKGFVAIAQVIRLQCRWVTGPTGGLGKQSLTSLSGLGGTRPILILTQRLCLVYAHKRRECFGFSQAVKLMRKLLM